ncbi:hypothetical protein, partial [Salmonella sp. s55004]|uniref:hypothetical protein n=1 Tax=Salmonella sp. s55004 TaxID=3159675 RepID=UPI00397FB71C
MINFNPAAGEGQRGFNMTAEAEKELQERWQQDTQPSDQSKAPKPEEDDGPQVQENMTPGALPPSSQSRTFNLSEDDKKELQDMWNEPVSTDGEVPSKESRKGCLIIRNTENTSIGCDGNTKGLE